MTMPTIATDNNQNSVYERLYAYITASRDYGCSDAWCLGYVQAYHNTRIITTNEYNKLLVLIHTTN